MTADGNVKVGGNFDGDEIEAGKGVILATGSVPKPIPGTSFGGRVIGTEEAWALERAARPRMAVVGAGASGTEIASAYARLGVERHALRGARPRAADRGRRRLQARRARLQEAGHRGPHGTFVEDVQATDDERDASRYGDEPARSTGSSSPRAAAPTSRASASRRRASSSTTPGSSPSTARCARRAEGVWAIGDLVAGPGARAQGLRRGHHRRRGDRRPRDAPDRVRRHPARDVLHAERRQLRAHRGAGARGRARRRRRQAAVRRGRRRHGLRRPHRPREDRRRQAVRRAAGRAHRRRRAPPSSSRSS